MMEFWLDTIDESIIKSACEIGILTGVTTNPAILSKADNLPEQEIKQLLAMQSGYVAAQVVANDFKNMLEQGRRLAALDKRMVIKIPVTPDGLRVISTLAKENIATLATTIFESNQVLLAAMAGAKYAAFYLSKMEELNSCAWTDVEEMLQIITAQNYSLKLMAASIKSTKQISDCAKLGIHAITVPDAVYHSLLAVPAATEKSLVGFNEMWNSGKHTAASQLFN